jgi:hypothetical protein
MVGEPAAGVLVGGRLVDVDTVGVGIPLAAVVGPASPSADPGMVELSGSIPQAASSSARSDTARNGVRRKKVLLFIFIRKSMRELRTKH